MTEPVRVSVVVSTYQRRTKLAGLIAALDAQALPLHDYEVVVVDNGSTDSSYDELVQLARESRVHLRPVRVDVNHGPAAGRNAGWRAAVGEVIAFTDDDCIPTPQWLSAGLQAMTRDNVVVVGRTTPNPEQITNHGPFSRTQRVTDTRFMQTCNVFYRRADLELVDGFDETIRVKGGEDTDLGWRVADAGRDVVFEADALVLHDVSPSCYRAALREASSWVDLPRVAAVHPRRARRLLYRRVFWKRSHPPALLALAGLVAAGTLRRPEALVAMVPWLRLRLLRQPVARRPLARLALLPQVLLLDAAEITTMVRGSIRHRTVVL